MLEQLGMIKNRLTWDGICERAEWFSKRGVVERERAMFLIKYVAECLDGSKAPSEQQMERLKAAEWTIYERFFFYVKKYIFCRLKCQYRIF